MIRVEPVREEDVPAIEAYLEARAETSMFLRSNLARAGVAWSGARYQAQYVLAWDGDALAGIAGHFWNDNVLLQSDAHAGALAVAAVARSGRRVAGLVGPLEQVRVARAALGLAGAAATLDHDEVLMTLALDRLIVPPALVDGRVRIRRGAPGDRAIVARWRAAYTVELSGATAGPANDAGGEAWFDTMMAEDVLWVAEADGAPAAIAAFNAVVGDCVQLGGVYTPPALRGRGHARAAVAGSLIDARATGATRAILFTPRADAATAYRAIGFEVIGPYGVVVF